ncbi:DUF4198 domain-containing protein [Kiloniella laminariae]|uniref:DUF4198 domain-containing protein n=1 Tax=Kiloniella laminariae TaxID=454162 RepID=A0ABT4LQ56_9PROT|nr:DUF4198 domain-containing protein [Kiloniella laminariae]MCZ4282057.1 DUF4198 domain-containing protein [Kiloniella laminariae]
MRKIFFTCLTLLILPASSYAHGIWITERFGNHAIVYGHGASDDPYDFKKIISIDALDQTGNKSPLKITETKAHAILKTPRDTSVIFATFDNGFWSQTDDGKWHNKTKQETEGATFTGRYQKFTTAIIDKTLPLFSPSGMKLEIVPLSNPLKLHQGDELSIQVFYDGIPAEGLKVIGEYTTDGESPPLVTDATGKVTLKVRNQGLNVIAVSKTVAVNDNPEIEEEGYFSTLSFSLDHSHD